MKEMMSMAINDAALDDVNGGIAGSFDNNSVHHAVVKKIQGPSVRTFRNRNTAAKKNRRPIYNVRNTVMSGTRPRLILL